MYESSLQSLAERHPDWLFPDYAFTLVHRQMALTGGVLDVLYDDADGVRWVTELKRGQLVPADVRQVLRYTDEVQRLHPEREVRAMLVGFGASEATKALAESSEVFVEILRSEHVRACAARAGIDDADARPRSRKTSAARPSVTRGPGLARQRNPEREALQRLLDTTWPPATLGGGTPRHVLSDYWTAACRAAPSTYRDLVVEVCLDLFSLVPSLTLSNRASGWTTVRLPNQRMLAAVNANQNRVKFDFPMPEVPAERARDRGLVRLDQPRQGGYWVQAIGLRTRDQCLDAVALFRDSLPWALSARD